MDFTEFLAFKESIERRYGDLLEGGRRKFDNTEHVDNLNRLAEQTLSLPVGSVSFKVVYNTRQSVPLDKRKKQVHTLIFRVTLNGKVYSAGVKRRLSRSMNDRGGGKWVEYLREAYTIAVSKPPVGLDLSLATSKYKSSYTVSDGSIRTLWLRGENSTLTLSSRRGVIATAGPRDQIRDILLDLRRLGLNDNPPPVLDAVKP